MPSPIVSTLRPGPLGAPPALAHVARGGRLTPQLDDLDEAALDAAAHESADTEPYCVGASPNRTNLFRDLWVRAFRQGARWQQQQEEALIDLTLPALGDDEN